MRWMLIGILGMSLLAGCGSSSKPTAGSHLDTDLQYIAGQVQLAQAAVSTYSSSATSANLEQLAQTAQTAHDQIGQWKDNIGVDGNASSGAVFAQHAADELETAMGSLVAFAETPGEGVLGTFASQFGQAVSDWNSAVTALYSGVKTSETPPTLSCPNC